MIGLSCNNFKKELQIINQLNEDNKSKLLKVNSK